MAVKIRLARTGKKNQPTYRLIVIDESKKRNGRFLENLGYYNPTLNPPIVNFNKSRFDYWVSVGAKPTPTVKNFVKKNK